MFSIRNAIEHAVYLSIPRQGLPAGRVLVSAAGVQRCAVIPSAQTPQSSDSHKPAWDGTYSQVDPTPQTMARQSSKSAFSKGCRTALTVLESRTPTSSLSSRQKLLSKTGHTRRYSRFATGNSTRLSLNGAFGHPGGGRQLPRSTREVVGS